MMNVVAIMTVVIESRLARHRARRRRFCCSDDPAKRKGQSIVLFRPERTPSRAVTVRPDGVGDVFLAMPRGAGEIISR